MKTDMFLPSRRVTVATLGLAGCCLLTAGDAEAQTSYPPPAYQQPQQQSGSGTINNFYRRGDAMSERVSGFMRKIFGGGQRNTSRQQTYNQPSYSQPQTSGAYNSAAGQQSAPPPISNYERPSTSPNTGVYGYSTSPSGGYSSTSQNKPAQAASRQSSQRKTLVSPRKPAQTAATENRSSTYTPPQVSTTPPKPAAPPSSAPAPVQSTPPASTEKAVDDLNGFLAPGTVINTPPEQPKMESKTEPTTSNGVTTTKVDAPAPPPPPPASPSTSDTTPVGKKGSKPGRVVSPYPPNNELDVTGLESGSLALDPTTNKVFKVP